MVRCRVSGGCLVGLVGLRCVLGLVVLGCVLSLVCRSLAWLGVVLVGGLVRFVCRRRCVGRRLGSHGGPGGAVPCWLGC